MNLYQFQQIFIRKIIRFCPLCFLFAFPIISSGQSAILNQCSVLDSIFNRLEDLFPEKPRGSVIRLYDLSDKGMFKDCNEYEYGIWNVYYFDKLKFDVNSGESLDFIILEDEILDTKRTVRFFYAQAFCEHNIRNRMTGYINLEYSNLGIRIINFSHFYAD